MTQTNEELWEQSANWWQEKFTNGVDPEYTEQIEPIIREHTRNSRRVLDIGTGEGQLARLCGNRAIGVDISPSQLAMAAERGGGPSYLRAHSSHLPFKDAEFDTAIACLVFEHVDDFETAFSEISRMLEPGGQFLFFLNHPLLQTPGSGWIDDHILEEQYWRIGPYLIEDKHLEELDKGVFIPFIHRPLSTYVNSLARFGLLIREMLEPAPPTGFLKLAPEYAEAATIPRLLLLRTEKQ